MIFKMTGQPVSQEMQDAIDRLEHGNHVPSSEIDKIPEVKLAYSILESQGKYTNIDLETRKPLQDSVYKEMEQITSAAVDENGEIVVDENGETVYNGIVNKEARLDIIMGLPASGKSSSLVDPISSEFKSRLIDNDEAKKRFPEYNNGWGAEIVHNESKVLCDKLFSDCILKKENIVLPKVGSDATKLLQDYIQMAKAEGYKVYVHFADLDRNKALGRMLGRFCEKGRFLKPELADKYAPVKNGKTQNYIQDAYEALKTSGMVDGFTKWDNDVAKGEKPVLLENIGCEGKFIDNARTEKEVQGYGEYEPRGHEQSGHEILGDYGSGGGVRGKESHSNVVRNEKLEAIPQSSEGDKASVVRSSLGQLPASGDYGDEHRGSAGIRQKSHMTDADRDEANKPFFPLDKLKSDKEEKIVRDKANALEKADTILAHETQKDFPNGSPGSNGNNDCL